MTPAVYSLAFPKNPNSCLVKLYNLELRALIDTGSDFSLINETSFLKLNYQPKLTKVKIILHAANGQSLTLLGSCVLRLNCGGRKIPTEFIVVKDLKRNVILGTDFFVANFVNIYYSIRKIKIQDVYLDFLSDAHLASILTTKDNVILNPMSINYVKVDVSKELEKGEIYQVFPPEKGLLEDEPLLEISPIITKIGDTHQITLQIVNFLA